MVAFPGETDEDFQKTLRLMELYPFSFIDIFEYSDRPNTVSSRLPNKVDEKIKKVRYRQALQLGQWLYMINNQIHKR